MINNEKEAINCHLESLAKANKPTSEPKTRSVQLEMEEIFTSIAV